MLERGRRDSPENQANKPPISTDSVQLQPCGNIFF